MNRLAAETSPYLLQHKDNPVDWWPWCPEALERAQAESKPILLSVGYAACHWCHVMAHESFEDDGTAGLMNRLYVNIKVDREERPELDAIYQHALALLGEQGGWPLTMFLTPKGEPFWGGTYFPPSPRFGRPSFHEVLEGIDRIWREGQDKVEKNVAALQAALDRWAGSTSGGAVTPAILDQVATRLAQEVDPVEGGIGGAPKFPNTPLLQLFWRAFWRSGEASYRQAVELTLARMSNGGIYDHLGGGYARYAVDEIWLVPHFEKMLYDNAQILELLTQAWCLEESRLFQQRATETVDWTLREMRAAEAAPGVAENGAPAGPFVPAFAASLDADSEGHEGLFYIWTPAEIDAELAPDDAALFKERYDVTAEGNFEGRNILNRRRHAPAEDDAEEAARLALAREALLVRRRARIWPGWDDKVLADWNGLMIAAMASAGRVFGRGEWLDAARDALAFIDAHHVRSNGSASGRLHHSWRRGVVKHAATLDDHAQLARAALILFEATGDAGTLAFAKRLVALADEHYWDEAGGGYFMTADDAEALVVRSKSAQDSAVPSGNGTMVEVLARLHYITGEADYRGRAERTVAAFTGELERNFFPLATLLNGAEFLDKAVQVAIVGRRGEPATEALVDAAWCAGNPWRVLQVVAPGETLAPGHPAGGKAQLEGKPTAYVCHGQACSLPIIVPEELRRALVPPALA